MNVSTVVSWLWICWTVYFGELGESREDEGSVRGPV